MSNQQPKHAKWDKQAFKERETPKFIPKGMTIRIFPDKEPQQTIVDGKFGKRPMYILNSNIGLIYVSNTQFVLITERMRMADWPENGVDWP